MNVFDGLLGYEKLMLICGFALFVFALTAITAMIVQRRDFKAAMALIVLAIVLMGFPGIQAVKFSEDTVELSRIRAQPQPSTNPAQQEKAQQVLSNLEQRATGNLQLQAQVSDGYRAIGELDEAWRLAKSVLHQQPSPQVQATLVPVLTAKLNQVQAGVPIAAAPTPAAGTGSAPASAATVAATPAPATTVAATPAPSATVAATPGPATSVATTPPAASPGAPSATSSAASPAAALARQREIAAIAKQLQHTDAALPATSHAALAKAYVVLGQPQRAQANIEEARRLDPNIKINPAVLRAARTGGNP